jgi:hypothetical protein
MNPWTADRLAIAAGLHPFSVWDEAWGVRAIDTDRGLEVREHRPGYEGSTLSL